MSQSTDKERSIVEAIIVLVLMVPSMLWGGYVGHILWGWFLVPLGVSAVGVFHFMGIQSTIGFILISLYINTNGQSESKGLSLMLHYDLAVLFTLILGAIFHALM